MVRNDRVTCVSVRTTLEGRRLLPMLTYLRQKGTKIVNRNIVRLLDEFVNLLDGRFLAVDGKYRGSSSVAPFAALVAVNLSFQHVHWLARVRRQSQLDFGNLLFVHDKGTSIVRTAQQLRFASQSEANGAQNRGFSWQQQQKQQVKSALFYHSFIIGFHFMQQTQRTHPFHSRQ